MALPLHSPCRNPKSGCECLGKFFSFSVIKEQFHKAKSRCGTGKVSTKYRFKKKKKQLYKDAVNKKTSLFLRDLYPFVSQNT